MKIVSLQTSRHCFCFIVGVVVVVGLLLSNAVVDATPMATETNNECLNPVIGDVLFLGGICEPDCYCIPDRDPCEECPTLDNRVIAASAQGQEDANFFNSLEIDNVNTLFTFNTTNNVTGGCQPYPRVAQFLQVPVCDGLIQGLSLLSDDDDSSKKMGKKAKKSKKSKKKKGRLDDDDEDVQYQCSFDYGTDICESNKYNLVQEMVKPTNNKKKGKKNKKTKAKNDESNTFITHEGTCGVCSTSKDLAINLSPTLDGDAFACTANATGAFQTQDPAQIVSVFPNLINCFQNIGFTSDCAFIWASNGLNTLLTLFGVLQQFQQSGVPPLPGPALPASCIECALDCATGDPTTNPDCGLPISPGTCELTPCFSCDEDASGAIFKQYSGRTRRNSGIVTTRQVPFDPFPFVGTKRECSTISNIKQPSRTAECSTASPTASPTATSIPGSESPGSESPGSESPGSESPGTGIPSI